MHTIGSLCNKNLADLLRPILFLKSATDLPAAAIRKPHIYKNIVVQLPKVQNAPMLTINTMSHKLGPKVRGNTRFK